MLSVQIITPSSGTWNVSPSVPDEARSPDQTIAAHVFLAAKLVRYALPTMIRPLSTSGLMSSYTACRSSAVVCEGSAVLPSFSSPRPNVSRDSVRKLSFFGSIAHRSLRLFGGWIPADASVLVLKPIPVLPDRHAEWQAVPGGEGTGVGEEADAVGLTGGAVGMLIEAGGFVGD